MRCRHEDAAKNHQEMSAGKGDKPRNCFSKEFRSNYDEINWDKNKIVRLPHYVCRGCGTEHSGCSMPQNCFHCSLGERLGFKIVYKAA